MRWIPVDEPPPAAYPAASGYGHAPQPRLIYGGLLIRFVAYLLDSLIIGVPMGVLLVVLFIAGVVASPVSPSDVAPPPPGATTRGALYLNPPAILVFYLFVLLVAAGYYAYFWSASGATPPMRLFKLRVVDANSGQPIGIGPAVARYIGLIVAPIPCSIRLICA